MITRTDPVIYSKSFVRIRFSSTFMHNFLTSESLCDPYLVTSDILLPFRTVKDEPSKRPWTSYLFPKANNFQYLVNYTFNHLKINELH